jgi:hypothetical protein
MFEVSLSKRGAPLEYNFDGKVFKSLCNTKNGEVSSDTLFHYHQQGTLVWAEYEGGDILKGHLIATVLPTGQLDMRYHHVNRHGEIMIGTCLSTPERTSNGKLKLREEWQWLCGDMSSGYSEVLEQ